MEGDSFIPTDQPSTKVFTVAKGHKTPGSRVGKLHHPVREPERTVDIVPGLADQSLISGEKFSKAGNVSICDDEEVNIYDGRTVKIIVSEEAVLTGWRCPRTRMWRTPLQHTVKNDHTDTLILNSSSGMEPLNSVYSLPSSDHIKTHIAACCNNLPPPAETINNVYEIPSIEPAIRYLHGAAGFPTKATWLKAIRKGSYLSWPLVNVKNVSKYFPDSEETQKGHMRSQRQAVRSTKMKAPTREAAVFLGGNGTTGGAAQIDIAPVPIVKKK